MKKRVLFISALASVFMNLNAEEIQKFTNGKKKLSGNNTIEIYPSKISKTKDRKSWEYGKEQIIPLTNKPVLSLEDFEYRKIAGGEPGIEVFLNDRNAKQLEKISKKYLKEMKKFILNMNMRISIAITGASEVELEQSPGMHNDAQVPHRDMGMLAGIPKRGQVQVLPFFCSSLQ